MAKKNLWIFSNSVGQKIKTDGLSINQNSSNNILNYVVIGKMDAVTATFRTSDNRLSKALHLTYKGKYQLTESDTNYPVLVENADNLYHYVLDPIPFGITSMLIASNTARLSVAIAGYKNDERTQVLVQSSVANAQIIVNRSDKEDYPDEQYTDDVKTDIDNLWKTVGNVVFSDDIQNETLANHESRITANASEIANIKTKNSEQDTKITAIEDKNKAQDTLLKTHGERLDGHDASIKSLEDADVIHDQRLDAVEKDKANIVDVNAQIDEVVMNQDEINTQHEHNLATERNERTAKDIDLQEQIDSITASANVVAIVGTYAELLKYPTDKLADGDTIQVLNDETHENASAYYSWNLKAKKWDFVGSQAPVYTKSEIDSKLSEIDKALPTDIVEKNNKIYLYNDGVEISGQTAPIQFKTIDGNKIFGAGDIGFSKYQTKKNLGTGLIKSLVIKAYEDKSFKDNAGYGTATDVDEEGKQKYGNFVLITEEITSDGAEYSMIYNGFLSKATLTKTVDDYIVKVENPYAEIIEKSVGDFAYNNAGGITSPEFKYTEDYTVKTDPDSKARLQLKGKKLLQSMSGKQDVPANFDAHERASYAHPKKDGGFEKGYTITQLWDTLTKYNIKENHKYLAIVKTDFDLSSAPSSQPFARFVFPGYSYLNVSNLNKEKIGKYNIQLIRANASDASIAVEIGLWENDPEIAKSLDSFVLIDLTEINKDNLSWEEIKSIGVDYADTLSAGKYIYPELYPANLPGNYSKPYFNANQKVAPSATWYCQIDGVLGTGKLAVFQTPVKGHNYFCLTRMNMSQTDRNKIDFLRFNWYNNNNWSRNTIWDSKTKFLYGTMIFGEDFKRSQDNPSVYCASAVGGSTTISVGFDGIMCIDLTAQGDGDLTPGEALAKYSKYYDIIKYGPEAYLSNFNITQRSKNLIEAVNNTQKVNGVTAVNDGNKIKLNGAFSTPAGFLFELKKPYKTVAGRKYTFVVRINSGTSENPGAIRVEGESSSRDLYTFRGLNRGPGEETFIGDGREIKRFSLQARGSYNNYEIEVQVQPASYTNYDIAPYLDPIDYGNFEIPNDGRINFKFKPKENSFLDFTSLEPADSLPVFADNKQDLTKSYLEYQDKLIKDNWASIVSKTNTATDVNNKQQVDIDALKDKVFSTNYNTYVGIQNSKFEYHKLSGIQPNSVARMTLQGQEINNLLNLTQDFTVTDNGLTIKYTAADQVFTVNGTSGGVKNVYLASGYDLGIAPNENINTIRYYLGGSIDLNNSYVSYITTMGDTITGRVTENSESLYDPYISNTGTTADPSTRGNLLILQTLAAGIKFTDFRFKIAIYKGTSIHDYYKHSDTPVKTNVTIHNRTINLANITKFRQPEPINGLTFMYNPNNHSILINGTATADTPIDAGIEIFSNVDVKAQQTYALSVFYETGNVDFKNNSLDFALIDKNKNSVVDLSFNDSNYLLTNTAFGTSLIDSPSKAVLFVKQGQVFSNYSVKVMLAESSIENEYVPFIDDTVDSIILTGKEPQRKDIEFNLYRLGYLDFVINEQKDEEGNITQAAENVVFAKSLNDTTHSYLSYIADNVDINFRVSQIYERLGGIDYNVFGKTIAFSGDSVISNNPGQEEGYMYDTSIPAMFSRLTHSPVLNFGVSGSTLAENTKQNPPSAAMVNRIDTDDMTRSAEAYFFLISFNDFKLGTPLGLSAKENKDKTTFYGALRTLFDKAFTKYPGKPIIVMIPMKREDDNVIYPGGSAYPQYLQAIYDVCKEYGVAVIDLNKAMPVTPNTPGYDQYMLNYNHFNTKGNRRVAELCAQALLNMNAPATNHWDIPAVPDNIKTADYVLEAHMLDGQPHLYWVRKGA